MKKTKIKKIISAICVWLVASSLLAYGVIQIALFVENPIPVQPIAAVNAARTDKADMPIRLYVLNEVFKAGLDVNAIDNMIGDCENRGWDTEASYINYKNKAGIDRGLWMINSISHKEVSNACAYDLACSTKEAIRIIKQRGLKEWTCGKRL